MSLERDQLKMRLASIRFGALDYKTVISEFKDRRPAAGGNYHSDGTTLSLFGHPIAHHKSDTHYSVSNAGYPTHTTHKALRELGVDIRRKSGKSTINGKPYNDGDFVDHPK